MADPPKATWESLEIYYQKMDPIARFTGKPTNVAGHDLCINNKAPVGIENLLGLGGKYCLKRTSLKSLEHTLQRLKQDVRRNYLFREAEDSGDYIPRLYIRSDWEAPLASDDIELCLNNFELALNAERRRHCRKPICPNLTAMQQALARRLEKNDIYKRTEQLRKLGNIIIAT